MDLMDLLQGQLGDGLLNQISKQLGGADKQQTQTAASSAINILLGAMNKNTNDPNGASALASALDRDHDGSILDDVMGMVTGQKQVQNPRMVNGAGIVKHILGGKQGNAIDMISKLSGLDGNKAGNLMSMLAPLVMGALGKHKRQHNLDAGGISDLLTKTVKSHASKNAQMGLVEKFLDADGDGSVMDDLLNIGMKFFRKR